jgi:hypothetical protein
MAFVPGDVQPPVAQLVRGAGLADEIVKHIQLLEECPTVAAVDASVCANLNLGAFPGNAKLYADDIMTLESGTAAAPGLKMLPVGTTAGRLVHGLIKLDKAARALLSPNKSGSGGGGFSASALADAMASAPDRRGASASATVGGSARPAPRMHDGRAAEVLNTSYKPGTGWTAYTQPELESRRPSDRAVEIAAFHAGLPPSGVRPTSVAAGDARPRLSKYADLPFDKIAGRDGTLIAPDKGATVVDLFNAFGAFNQASNAVGKAMCVSAGGTAETLRFHVASGETMFRGADAALLRTELTLLQDEAHRCAPRAPAAPPPGSVLS